MINNISTIDQSQGHSISVVGDTYRLIIGGEQTAGTYAVIDMLVPPGGGPGPHLHTNITEMFYVVDGEIEFKTEAGKYTAEKGAFVNIPKGGEVHCFKNISSEPANLLCIVMPAGLDEFFEQIGTPVEPGVFLAQQEPDAQTLEKLKQLAEQHGQKLFPPDYLDK